MTKLGTHLLSLDMPYTIVTEYKQYVNMRRKWQ